eukprot:TRINITY_DN16053_c0_g1_i1.p1 TRINITY_DN16053_c0_g1~~TRINITY_DN16053_c0_g1_i1.p1  ORF type:complete len:377 (+),score=89.49 TRINITY_DN16053_c0_g1_i1:168-1298(+)
MTDSVFYCGTYTRKEDHVDGKGPGIYLVKLEDNTGKMTNVKNFQAGINPSFITIYKESNNDKLYLYAINETEDSKVCAFEIDQNNRDLIFLNEQSLNNSQSACYVDTINSSILVANYTSGNICCLDIEDETGKVSGLKDNIFHKGSSIHDRQKTPHCHCIKVNNGNVYVCDLGIDRVVHYRLNEESNKLDSVNQTSCTAGSGPRHIVFNESYAFVLCEINNTIEMFHYNSQSGNIQERSFIISSLPSNYNQLISDQEDNNNNNNENLSININYSADIHVHPNNRFLYCSNRGKHNSISIFEIDNGNHSLTFIDDVDVLGEFPRSFCISNNGKWIVVGNQNSDNLLSFKINEEDGKLELVDQIKNIYTPVSIKQCVS